MSTVIVKTMFHLDLNNPLYPIFSLQEIKGREKPAKQHLKEAQKTTNLVY